MGIGEFPQQAENRFRVTKTLLAEEWVLKKSFKIWKNFRLILFVSWSRIQMRNFNLLRVTLDIEKEVPYGFHDD